MFKRKRVDHAKMQPTSCLAAIVRNETQLTASRKGEKNSFMLAPYLKVLGHGHMFEVGILIFNGSDIIIQIRTRGFGVI